MNRNEIELLEKKLYDAQNRIQHQQGSNKIQKAISAPTEIIAKVLIEYWKFNKYDPVCFTDGVFTG